MKKNGGRMSAADNNNADNGNTVKVHYTGRLEDGTVFDSSEGREPLEVTLGSGSVIPGFEKGLLGMKVDEKKTITIPAEEAYGLHREELTMQVPKTDFPDEITPEVGLQLDMEREDGQNIPVTIVNIENESVTLDANHPLAGKALIFDLTLVEVA